MGAYMYPITIIREPREVVDHIQVELGNDNELSFARLRECGVLDGDTFEVYPSDFTGWDLYITRRRLETPEEVSDRVAREELYMKRYNRRQEILRRNGLK